MSGKPTKFVEQPPALICPVCQGIFREPVISVKCGHTFCRACIEEVIRNGLTCPIDEQECDSSHLVLNRAVIGQIDDLQVYCCHGLRSLDGGKSYELDPSGCKEVLRVSARDEHEMKCQYEVVSCPVGGEQCGPLRKHQLERHMLACTRVPCPFTDFGCVYRGTSQEVTEHKSQCSYKDESQLLAITMKELKTVRGSNDELQQSMTRALKALDKLSAERSTMSAQLEQQALTITTLTSRMDRMETELEAFKSVRLRGHSSSTRLGDPTHRYTRPSAAANEHKRWSTDSSSSLAYTPAEAHRRPFIWQMPFTVKCIGTFKGHKGTIWSLVSHADRLYSASGDATIKVWDISDLRNGCLKTVHAHKDCIMCLAVGRHLLYSTGTDLMLRSWQLDTLEEVGVVQGAHDGIVSAMVCSKEFVFTSSFGCIKVWDAITLKEVHKIDGISQSWVRALVYSARRDCLYSATNNRILLWKGSDDFSLQNELDTQYGAIYSLAVTKKYIITGTHNQNVQVYDVASLRHVCSLSGHIGIVTVLKVTESSHGQFMFSGSSDTTVQVWNLENMLPILALQRHEKAVQSMALCQDAVFTGSEDMEIKVFRHFKL